MYVTFDANSLIVFQILSRNHSFHQSRTVTALKIVEKCHVTILLKVSTVNNMFEEFDTNAFKIYYALKIYYYST